MNTHRQKRTPQLLSLTLKCGETRNSVIERTLQSFSLEDILILLKQLGLDRRDPGFTDYKAMPKAIDNYLSESLRDKSRTHGALIYSEEISIFACINTAAYLGMSMDEYALWSDKGQLMSPRDHNLKEGGESRTVLITNFLRSFWEKDILSAINRLGLASLDSFFIDYRSLPSVIDLYRKGSFENKDQVDGALIHAEKIARYANIESTLVTGLSKDELRLWREKGELPIFLDEELKGEDNI